MRCAETNFEHHCSRCLAGSGDQCRLDFVVLLITNAGRPLDRGYIDNVVGYLSDHRELFAQYLRCYQYAVKVLIPDQSAYFDKIMMLQ